MVAGGLTINGQGQSLPLDSVESLTLDVAGEPWFQEAKLPNMIIGAVSLHNTGILETSRFFYMFTSRIMS